MSKTKCKKILAAMLCLTLCFSLIPFNGLKAYAICCRKNGFDKSKYTLTGNMAEDVATIAKSQKGRTCEQFGYSGVDYGLWCDEFVADCLENAGADSSIVGHGGTVSDFRSVMINKGAKVVTSPQTGDLVFFTNGSRLSHVEIVTKVSNGVVYCAGGNNGSWPGVCQGEHIAKNQGTISSYLRPNYPNSKHTVTIHYNANGGTIASDSSFYADSNGDIYKHSTDKLAAPVWEAGYKDSNGLYNASTLKLTRKNCEFLGWSLEKNSGTIFDQDDSSVSANDLYPNVTKQNGTVTLYAQWGGHVMSESEGAGQTLPDGDYWITSAISTRYLVDIPGDNFDTTNGKNVQMHLWSGNNWGEYDVFTIKYRYHHIDSSIQENLDKDQFHIG